MIRIELGKKNYYRILGVPKSAQEEEIKRAYKKLAIKLHPDKNKAPETNEAFKKVSAAYACLTDEKRRTIYDITGEEPENMPREGAEKNGSAQTFEEEEFEATIDPEEIFRMFFAGGLFDDNRTYHRMNDPNYKTRR